MNKAKIFFAGAALLLLIAIAVGFYLSNKKEAINPSEFQNGQTIIGEIEGLGTVEIRPDGGKNSGTGKTYTYPMPDLDRPVKYATNLSATLKSELVPKISSLIKDLKAENTLVGSWLELGVALKNVGDYEYARDAWEFAKTVSPQNDLLFWNLGDLYHYYLKNYPKAEENLKDLITLRPNSAPAYRALIDLYQLSYKEKVSEIPNILNAALKANKDNAELLITAGSYYKGEGNKTKALDYFNQALAVAEKAKDTDLVLAIRSEIQKLQSGGSPEPM